MIIIVKLNHLLIRSMVNDNKTKLDNIIFVCDRSYFSYDLMNFLNNNNYKYVIRIKNNCKYINSKNSKNLKKSKKYT